MVAYHSESDKTHTEPMTLTPHEVSRATGAVWKTSEASKPEQSLRDVRKTMIGRAWSDHDQSIIDRRFDAVSVAPRLPLDGPEYARMFPDPCRVEAIQTARALCAGSTAVLCDGTGVFFR